MNISVSKDLVNVYIGDVISETVSRERAREMKAAGTHSFINHGQDLRLIQVMPSGKTLAEKKLGWRPPNGRLRASVLNEGRVGQFTIGYPIPYAWEGHLRMPRAEVINRCAPTAK